MLLRLIVERAAIDNAVNLAGDFLDLTELNAVSEVLDLSVHSAVEVQNAVLVKAAEVACAVNQLAVVGVERILDKRLLGVARVAVVTERENGAAYADLTCFTDSNRLVVFGEKGDSVVVIRRTDRQNGVVAVGPYWLT